MIDYVGSSSENVIKKGEKLDVTLPNPIATVNFDAYSAGVYIVEVDENGNWTSAFRG